MAKQQGTDLDDLNTGGGKKARLDDTITVFKFPEKKWVTFRIYGPMYTYGGYWVTAKKKDGSKTKFYVDCPSYDPATQSRDSSKYDPWRDFEAAQGDADRDAKLVNFSTFGITNAILRQAQRSKPATVAKPTKAERTTGFKDKDSDSYTPVVALKLPYGAVAKLKEQAGLNVVDIKGQTKTFSITHPKYGCDVRIMFNPDKAPADKYQVSIGERTPLTDKELELLKWDLSDLIAIPPEAEIKRDFEGWAKRMDIKVKGKKKPVEDDEDFDDDDGDDEPKSKKSKSDKPKSKKKPVEDDEDFDDDDGDDSDEDEDDEPKSKKSKGKAKPVDEDDEDSGDEDDDFGDDDEDSEDEDEDSEDDDEDSDDDEDEDEDEDDEPKSKKSKGKASTKSKGKKKPVDEDEDDDFGDDDDDDEDSDDDDSDEDSDDDSDDEDDEDEDEPKSKGKGKPKSVVKGKAKSKTKEEPKSKGKKEPVDEDDDFGDDDDDEEDDDEDEAPKKKKVASKTAKKKKR